MKSRILVSLLLTLTSYEALSEELKFLNCDWLTDGPILRRTIDYVTWVNDKGEPSSIWSEKNIKIDDRMSRYTFKSEIRNVPLLTYSSDDNLMLYVFSPRGFSSEIAVFNVDLEKIERLFLGCNDG